ncbi:MAG: tetratricopeptide repeat protein [Elusimicrobia bacterium]|nr:tetratricopeptide repeat protein [Elusimicrobiota bacterium]
MGKQWVRQELKRNELAAQVENVAVKVQENRQTAIAAAIGTLVVIAVAAGTWFHLNKTRTEAWEKLAIAQSLAYSGQAKPALEQLQPVIDGGSLPSSYAQLFAADVRFRTGDYKEAIAAYQRIVDRGGPKTLVPIALGNLALAQEAAGDCKAALESNQRLIDTNQDHFMAPQAQASMVRCFSATDQGAQAKSTLDRIVLLYPESYWAQWAKERLNPIPAKKTP